MNKVGNKIWKFIEKIVYEMLTVTFRVVQKDLTKEVFNVFMQFVKFGIIGLSNTIISYILYFVSLLLFRRLRIFPETDYLFAQLIQFMLSVLWSFFWNNRLVFTLQEGKKRSIWKALVKTYISYSFTGIFLNSLLLVMWVQIFSISEFIAPIINLLISVPLNFIINKFWAFRE